MIAGLFVMFFVKVYTPIAWTWYVFIGTSVTLSVGMVQLPPVMISAPFKILLFVLVDGWNLVIGSLVRSFN